MKVIRIVTILGLIVAAPQAGAAQGIATSYQELRLLVRPGDTVTVTDTSGQKVSGKISALSASSLALMVDGRAREWGETDVTTITQRRGDSLANGALIGLGVGAGVVAVGLAIVANDDAFSDEPSVGEAAAVIAIYGGLGAAIGVGVDALITRHQVIFERRSASGVSVAIAPLVAPARAGARLSVRF